jgi:dTMP kinase
VTAARLSDEPDRLEQEGAPFHARVAAAFRQLAAADPERWVTVPADGTVDEVAARVWEAVNRLP